MLSLNDARTKVQNDGIEKFYKLYRVQDPHNLMLNVIFNVIWSSAYKNATAEEKETLNFQRAIFELAAEQEIKNPSLY